jgi:DNA-binding MarR family transcriptional regulator
MMSKHLIIERSFGFLVHDVARLLGKKFDRRVRGLGLSRAQCRALFYLARNEGMNQASLADLMDVEPITLARLLDRMEAAGWVERRCDPDDRRAHKLFLQDKAWPILEEAWTVASDVREETLSGLSEAERTTLMTLLERVHATLSRPAVAEEDHHA